MPRVSPSPFLRGNSWWARIPRLGADAIQRPLGVLGKANRDVAVEVCRFLGWCKGRRESFLLDAIAEGKTTAGAAHTAYVENRLDAFVAELRDGVKDADLEPLVAQWQRELVRRKRPNADTRAKYLRQVRTLIPEGKPFRRSSFTKQRIREWLSTLDVGQPNRYRAALSSFAEFLVFEDAIPANPVILVSMAKEAEPRTLHLTQAEAKRLIDGFDENEVFRPFHALMLATGMEFGAALAVRPRDISADGVYAAGTKREHRKRTCQITDTWRWAWEIALAEIMTAEPDERPFRSIDVHSSLRALRRAIAAAKLDGFDGYTQHDHRHTWAVQGIRDGLALHVIAHQLGHRDASMVVRVYGRFRPTSADFKTSNATPSATATPQNAPDSEAPK